MQIPKPLLFDKQQQQFVYMQSLARRCAHRPPVKPESRSAGDTRRMTPVLRPDDRARLHASRRAAAHITSQRSDVAGGAPALPSAPQTLADESRVESFDFWSLCDSR